MQAPAVDPISLAAADPAVTETIPFAKPGRGVGPRGLLRPALKFAAAATLGVLLRVSWGLVPYTSGHHPFVAVKGLFAQEHGADGLTRSANGVVPNFGALVNWDVIHSTLGPERKLILWVRHAEGVHNKAQEVLGRAAWFAHISAGCTWATEGDMFDSPLTALGMQQVKAMNRILRQQGMLKRMVPDMKQFRVLSSPLSRTLRTAAEILKGLPVGRITATELCRESIGLYPCDARRSVSGAQDISPCPFSEGLEDSFSRVADFPMSHANLSFPITKAQHQSYLEEGAPLGLISDEDSWWQPKVRETPAQRAVRAQLLLASIFDHITQPIVLVTTHAGFIRDATRELGWKAYFAQNCELIPMVVEDRRDLYST